MSWDALARGKQVNYKLPKGAKTMTCCADIFVLFVAVRKRKTTPSLNTIQTWYEPARRNPMPGKKADEAMSELLEPFSEQVIAGDATLTRKSCHSGGERQSLVSGRDYGEGLGAC